MKGRNRERVRERKKEGENVWICECGKQKTIKRVCLCHEVCCEVCLVVRVMVMGCAIVMLLSSGYGSGSWVVGSG